MHLSRKVLRYILYQLLQDRALKSCYTQSEHCFDNFKDEPVLFEKEFDYDELMDNPNESFEVSINEDGVYVVNGPKIDKMLGYTNLESEKGI